MFYRYPTNEAGGSHIKHATTIHIYVYNLKLEASTFNCLTIECTYTSIHKYIYSVCSAIRSSATSSHITRLQRIYAANTTSAILIRPIYVGTLIKCWLNAHTAHTSNTRHTLRYTHQKSAVNIKRHDVILYTSLRANTQFCDEPAQKYAVRGQKYWLDFPLTNQGMRRAVCWKYATRARGIYRYLCFMWFEKFIKYSK